MSNGGRASGAGFGMAGGQMHGMNQAEYEQYEL